MTQIKLKNLVLEDILKEMAGKYDKLDKVLDALEKRKITKEQAKKYIMVLNYNDEIGFEIPPTPTQKSRRTRSSQGGISCGSSSPGC